MNTINFIPSICLGDPNLETTYDIAKTFILNKVKTINFILPFSDPYSCFEYVIKTQKRALENKVSIKDRIAIISKLTKEYDNYNFALTVCSNQILALGEHNFFSLIKAANVKALHIVDVPTSMLDSQISFKNLASDYQIKLILDVPFSIDECSFNEVKNLNCINLVTADINDEHSLNVFINFLTRLKDKNENKIILKLQKMVSADIYQKLKICVLDIVIENDILKLIDENYADKNTLLNKISLFCNKLNY